MKAQTETTEMMVTLAGWNIRYNQYQNRWYVARNDKYVAGFSSKDEAIEYCEKNSGSTTKQNTSELRLQECRITQRLDFDFPYYRIIRRGDILISKAEGDSIEDAEKTANEICKAVNNFESLVDALQSLCEYEERGRERNDPRISETWYNKAKSALNKLNSHS